MPFRTTTTLVVFSLLVVTNTVHAVAFSDVPSNHPHLDAINYVKHVGIAGGYPNGTFQPDAGINRVEFLKILVEAELSGSPLCRRQYHYSDVDWSAWYSEYVQLASCLGIVEGYPDGTFRPDGQLNYAEAAKIISGVFTFEVLLGQPWYAPFIHALDNRGATPRYNIQPADRLTRGEMAEIIYRLQVPMEDRTTTETQAQYANVISDDRMLLVLAAPSTNETYYKEDFAAIVEFHKEYVRTVLGQDNVVILVDEATKGFYSDLPSDVLLVADVGDIWMRDFSTVIPERPVQFTYYPDYWDSPADGQYVQDQLMSAMKQLGLSFTKSEYILDGGNIVDNGKSRLVTSNRFLEDNELTAEEGKQALKEITGATEVAIIPYDDEVMGHSDGMVMWVGDDVLLVNEYDEPFRSEVLDELKASFPTVEIVEVPAEYELTQWRNFNSACGVNVNSVVTYNHIYMPTFGNVTADAAAQSVIEEYTDKAVHNVDAQGVCHMGGSARCMVWQLAGENATKLIEAARR